MPRGNAPPYCRAPCGCRRVPISSILAGSFAGDMSRQCTYAHSSRMSISMLRLVSISLHECGLQTSLADRVPLSTCVGLQQCKLISNSGLGAGRRARCFLSANEQNCCLSTLFRHWRVCAAVLRPAVAFRHLLRSNVPRPWTPTGSPQTSSSSFKTCGHAFMMFCGTTQLLSTPRRRTLRRLKMGHKLGKQFSRTGTPACGDTELQLSLIHI